MNTFLMSLCDRHNYLIYDGDYLILILIEILAFRTVLIAFKNDHLTVASHKLAIHDYSLQLGNVSYYYLVLLGL